MRSLFARLFQAQLLVILITILVLGFSLSYMYTQYIFSLKEQELIRIGQRLAAEFGTVTLPLRITRIRTFWKRPTSMEMLAYGSLTLTAWFS